MGGDRVEFVVFYVDTRTDLTMLIFKKKEMMPMKGNNPNQVIDTVYETIPPLTLRITYQTIIPYLVK